MIFLRLIFFAALLVGCGNPQEHTDHVREKIIDGNRYVYKSFEDKELDSIWKYDKDGNLESVFTGDSTGKCLGGISGFYPTGELKFTGYCKHLNTTGEWFFYKKSGELNFVNFYTETGDMYQRWFMNNGDTLKLVYPIIEFDRRVANVEDSVSLRVSYNLDSLDTLGWTYYFVHDFIEIDKFTSDELLPEERFRYKIDGHEISMTLNFLTPDTLALYGYTLAVHQETGDTVNHLQIRDEFITILSPDGKEL